MKIRVDTYVVRSIMVSLAVIGWVLTAKGYLPWYVELPLTWGTFFLYLIPRTVFEFERNHV